MSLNIVSQRLCWIKSTSLSSSCPSPSGFWCMMSRGSITGSMAGTMMRSYSRKRPRATSVKSSIKEKRRWRKSWTIMLRRFKTLFRLSRSSSCHQYRTPTTLSGLRCSMAVWWRISSWLSSQVWCGQQTSYRWLALQSGTWQRTSRFDLAEKFSELSLHCWLRHSFTTYFGCFCSAIRKQRMPKTVDKEVSSAASALWWLTYLSSSALLSSQSFGKYHSTTARS